MAATLLWLEDRHFARGGKPRLTYTGRAHSSTWPDSPGTKMVKRVGWEAASFLLHPTATIALRRLIVLSAHCISLTPYLVLAPVTY